MQAFAGQRAFLILLVEDNPADVRLAREAFRDSQVRSELRVVADGEQALALLRRQDSYHDAPRPDLILLDLNLPGKDGREVLSEIKKDPQLRRIPVVILTTSQQPLDVSLAYDLHANGYIAKPLDLDEYLAAIRSFEHFWLETAILPNG